MELEHCPKDTVYKSKGIKSYAQNKLVHEACCLTTLEGKSVYSCSNGHTWRVHFDTPDKRHICVRNEKREFQRGVQTLRTFSLPYTWPIIAYCVRDGF